MTRRAILWTLDTVTALAVATVGACVVIRGLMLDEPAKPKRTETKRDNWQSVN